MKKLFTLVCSLLFTASVFAGEFPDISIAELKTAIAEKKVTVLDVNGSDSFKAGHIPGARNAPWAAVLGADGRMLPTQELLAHYTQLGATVPEAAPIAYCGSGVSACMNAIAMEHAGLTPPRMYVASFSGWSADPAHAVETGPGGQVA